MNTPFINIAKAIKSILAVYNLEADEQEIIKKLAELPKDFPYNEIVNKFSLTITKLNHILNSIPFDTTEKRTAGKLLYNLFDEKIFNLILDNDLFFNQKYLAKTITTTPLRVSLGEKAALLGAVKSCVKLFNEQCNPACYPSLLEHAMYASNEAWVFELIKRYKIDVTEHDSLFMLHANRLNNNVFKNYFEEQVAACKQSNTMRAGL